MNINTKDIQVEEINRSNKEQMNLDALENRLGFGLSCSGVGIVTIPHIVVRSITSSDLFEPDPSYSWHLSVRQT